MSRVTWDAPGERLFETGIDRCVLYVDGSDGVPWNGITEVEEKPSGGAPTPYYYDGQKYLNQQAAEEYEATITAFTYPDEFGPCDGSVEADTGMFVQHQPRVPFNLAYRTLVGNDIEGNNFAYRIHLIYGASASPTTREYQTLGKTSDAMDFSWDVTLLPPLITGYKSTGHIIFDSRATHPGVLNDLEDALYGTDDTDPRIPDFAELLVIVSSYADFAVFDNGDGTWTLTAPSSALSLDGDNSFTVDSNAVTPTGDTSYTISSN